LSEFGLKRIQTAVDKGYLKQTALLIPYSNLSTMWGKLDEPEKADKYYEAAARIQQMVDDSSSTIQR